jgi:hypothetical protein
MPAHAILGRNFVIPNAARRQLRTDPHFALIAVRRYVLTDHILPETGLLIDAEEAGDTARDTSNHAANDSADRSGCGCALCGPTLGSANDALRVCANRQSKRRSQHGAKDRSHYMYLFK